MSTNGSTTQRALRRSRFVLAVSLMIVAASTSCQTPSREDSDGKAKARVRSIQLGPRPFYLIDRMPPGALRDRLESEDWCEPRGIGPVAAEFLCEHCDAFLVNADQLGYHDWPKLPVLVDWNLGNFSVERSEAGLRLFSRWDYDWFRIEPRTLDFYFLSRVSSAVGDRSEFSYHVAPLLEPRFRLFLRAYHACNPLQRPELLFLKEVYRFFLLNYVIREGEHFFREEICRRLQRETVDLYLPSLLETDFAELVEDILS